jgi:hypothetical protein
MLLTSLARGSASDDLTGGLESGRLAGVNQSNEKLMALARCSPSRRSWYGSKPGLDRRPDPRNRAWRAAGGNKCRQRASFTTVIFNSTSNP